MSKRVIIVAAVLAASALFFVQWSQGQGAPAAAKAPEWPQWRGADRNGISTETGLLKEWPEGGPAVLWSASGLGEGFSSISVRDGRIYTMGTVDGGEAVIALDFKDGHQLWATKTSEKVFNEGNGNGPRSTPTTDGDRIYSEDSYGNVACLEAATGKILWQISLEKDLGGRRPQWGYAESPLIVDKAVVVTPGGSKGSIAALDKMTGTVIWQSSKAKFAVAYSSPILIDVKGKKEIVNATGSGGVKAGTMIGVDAATGELLWQFSTGVATIACCTPVYKDGIVVASSGYDKGTAAADVTGEAAKDLWHVEATGSHHGGMILLGDCIYLNMNALSCINLKDGKVLWQERSVGKGSLVYAGGLFYCLSEDNHMKLVEATSEGCKVKGSFDAPKTKRKNWAHPVVVGGRLFLRNQDTLTCYDVTAK